MAQLPGHLGATLAVKLNSDENELIVSSFWENLNSAGHFEQGDFDFFLELYFSHSAVLASCTLFLPILKVILLKLPTFPAPRNFLR